MSRRTAQIEQAFGDHSDWIDPLDKTLNEDRWYSLSVLESGYSPIASRRGFLCFEDV